jgi:hypothetical protein
MSTGAALLQEIIENPEADTPNGIPRAVRSLLRQRFGERVRL